MKILRLEASNFQRLKAVDITPKGNVVQITGRNANGKTSVLDAIWAALGGASHIHVKPIRTGATKAHIKLDLGEIIVTRSITEKGSTLTVENAEGLAYKSPQRMLDDLVGALAFDPLAFTRMKPKEQYDQVKGIAKLDVDVEALDGQNRRDYEQRAAINRDMKILWAQLDGTPPPSPAPEPQDLSILLEQQQNLIASQNGIQLATQQRHGKERTLEALRGELEQIRETFGRKKAEAESLEVELQSMPDATDAEELGHQIQAVKTEILNIQQTNEQAAEARRQIEKREDLRARAQELEKRSDDLTESMEARTKAKQEAIARAKMPVEGLGFGDGLVLYNDVPFEQASSAEQLRVSIAIAIASNPKLRVIRVQDGSLLDDTSLQVLTAMARLHDYQVWIEQVSNNNTVGVVIEDGAVLVDNYEGQPEQAEAKLPEPVSPETMDALRRGERAQSITPDLE